MELTKTKVRESVIEKKVKAYARKQGWLVYKFSSPGKRSVPDDIFLKKKYAFFIEFKATGGRATVAQNQEHGLLRDEGFVVLVIDSVSEGMRMVDYAETQIRG